MAALNQVVIDNNNGLVLIRSSLVTADDTAVFEALQKFTPDEAKQFGEALQSAAAAVQTTLDNRAKAADDELNRKSGSTKKKKTKKRAATKKAKKSTRRRR